MFTGIVEEIGSLAAIRRQGQTLQLVINASLVVSDVSVGDSIAVNGVCLTVTAFSHSCFTADVMPVTYRATNLAQLKINSKLNLERAMAANGRFGGHIVSGHIDGVATIVSKTRQENAILYRLKLPDGLAKYCRAKGSVALDGTSLTIVDANTDWLSVALIPHSQKKSLLGIKEVGALVNIECDSLSKTAALPETPPVKSISKAFLQQHGYL